MTTNHRSLTREEVAEREAYFAHMTSADVTNGRFVSDGEVRMADGILYCGPVWRWVGRTWVNYRNRPTEVMYYQGSWRRC